ncbi:phosphatase PAP2 family protein [Agrilutibacter solisilvae]|uniref:undecaprenyl-diphosphate phosphatase n=1 Tax=Agrilutibacter solisilvae TaxID=2763317 RepID=A0A975ARZ0_9GAMM|nr:phosphatase PAP2 family protein [Lysobacter solisilvae]QSX78217.1 phosphatase PAP2 family protein [Lysobacter solisilvae]
MAQPHRPERAQRTRAATARAPAPAVAQTVAREARFGAAFLRRFGLRLLLLFAGLLLPLWALAELIEEVRQHDPFPFDDPILLFAHAMARDGFDRAFLLFSRLGYLWGVVPFDVLLVVVLGLRRRAREALFAGLALGGSALLNLATKQVFARDRPSLWDSIAPEHTFSFPSGHAMGSMTLAWVLLLLSWRTRWRWPVAVLVIAFTVMVGLSRVYLGVHFPSDILAGWTAASVWTVTCFFMVFRHNRHPWESKAIPRSA